MPTRKNLFKQFLKQWFPLFVYFFFPFFPASRVAGSIPCATHSCFLRSSSLATAAVMVSLSALFAFRSRTMFPCAVTYQTKTLNFPMFLYKTTFFSWNLNEIFFCTFSALKMSNISYNFIKYKFLKWKSMALGI